MITRASRGCAPTCRSCGRHRWRETEQRAFEDPPDAERLARRALCTSCGGRDIEVTLTQKLPRWMDCFQPGGMRLGLATFDNCHIHDADRAAAMAAAAKPR